ncbi:cyclin N-terminal domain-containing protein 1 isoform X2 [Stigmatopora argus]
MAMAKENLAKHHSLVFRKASVEMLTDFLANLNEKNKDNLHSLPICSGAFKDRRLFEYTLLICQELQLDLSVGYHAIELLQRFMVKHIKHLLTGASAANLRDLKDPKFQKLQENFPLVVFSCVQVASKLSLQSRMVDTHMALRFLRSTGLDFSKQAVLKSELTVLKGLDFRLDLPNPLTFVEVLLEVLAHNEPNAPVERLYRLCRHVLQFVSLQRDAFYDAVLAITTQNANPTAEMRKKFVTVTEDCMMLGVGVIAAAAFILHVRYWEQVLRVPDGSLIILTEEEEQEGRDRRRPSIISHAKNPSA